MYKIYSLFRYFNEFQIYKLGSYVFMCDDSGTVLCT